jgi:hypothetical protein
MYLVGSVPGELSGNGSAQQCGGGTSEMEILFLVLPKHLEVSSPSNHHTNGTWSM